MFSMLIVRFSEHFPFPIDKASIMHIKAHLLFSLQFLFGF